MQGAGEPAGASPEAAAAGEEDRYFRLSTSDGLSYLKAVWEMAEKADRFLFEITRNNFLSFAALSVASTAGVMQAFADRKSAIVMVCIAAIAVSIGSAILSALYFHYSTHLYQKAFMVEKAWLRGKRSDAFVLELRNIVVPETEEQKAQRLRVTAGQVKVRKPGWNYPRVWPLGFYFSANLVPGAAAAALILAVHQRWVDIAVTVSKP